MSVTFALWRPRTGNSSLVRIYVNGTVGGKVHLSPSPRGGGVRLSVEDPDAEGEAAAQIMEHLSALGMATERLSDLKWTLLEELAQGQASAPRKRGSASGGESTVTPLHARRGGARPATYASRDVHRMSVASIPLERDVLIRVDHREPEEIASFLREHPRIRVEVQSLEIADYIIECEAQPTVLVERKTSADLQASVQSGRVFDQAQRIGQLIGPDCCGVALVEGDPLDREGWLPQATTGALTCLGLIQRLAVLNAIDAYHSAWTLVKLAHHASGSLGYELPLHKAKPKDLVDSRAYIIQSLPGISGELARRLLDHFGSVRAVFAATEDGLLAVPGFGKTKVKAIMAALGT